MSFIIPMSYFQRYSLLLRILAAIIGGYLLTNLIAILLSYLLPGSQADAVMIAMLSSFLIYAGVVMWVFTVKTLRQVWLGLAFSCMACTALIVVLMPEGLL